MVTGDKKYLYMPAMEGLASFTLPGLTGRVLLQDDGKRNKSEPAHYRLLLRE